MSFQVGRGCLPLIITRQKLSCERIFRPRERSVQHGKTLAQTIWPLPQWGHHKESFSVRRRAKACAVVSISDFTWRWVVGQRYTSTAESPDCCGRHNRLFETPLPLAKEILRLVAELRPQRRREAFDGYAFKSNRWEECVPMPGKMARSATRPPFGLPEVPVAVRTSRLSSSQAGKALIFTSVRESSGECGLSEGGDRLCGVGAAAAGALTARTRQGARPHQPLWKS
jgi:hypothetical protein